MNGISSEMDTAYDPMKTPYEIDEQEFLQAESLLEQFTFILRYVILAPSTYNTQPWKFAVSEGGIEVFADYSRRLPVVDPNSRELLMSIGAALFNLRVAAEHFGFDCYITYDHSGASDQPIARVAMASRQWHRVPDPAIESLFAVLTKRHTNRHPFLLSRIPASVLAQIRILESGDLAQLKVSIDGKTNEQVAELVATADRMQLADPSFRSNLAEWVRPNWTERTDGVTGTALGIGTVSSVLAPWTTRILDLGRVRAAKDRNLCVEAPGLVVIYGEDAVPHWLDAGELLEHLLLAVTREGLQYSYFNMPVQVADLRVELRKLLGLPAWPQLLLRIGYCLTEPAYTPRRPVQDVIIRM